MTLAFPPRRLAVLALVSCVWLLPVGSATSPAGSETELDRRVRAFLDAHSGQWHDMNVPESDGRLLRDIIVRHGYTRALEIGTSTGHSSIWIAWALSKTGGRLVTIEIDEARYERAVANFREAGLSSFIDARLADAHDLVKKLEGPFDFVFCDADKDGYTNYFKAISPKLEAGGCFTAHNARMRDGGIREFLRYVKSLPEYATEIDTSSRSGISLSYKKSSK